MGINDEKNDQRQAETKEGSRPRMASALVASAGSVDSVAAGAEPEMLSQIELRSPPATATAFLSLASSCHGSPMALTPTLRTE